MAKTSATPTWRSTSTIGCSGRRDGSSRAIKQRDGRQVCDANVVLNLDYWLLRRKKRLQPGPQGPYEERDCRQVYEANLVLDLDYWLLRPKK